MYEQPKERSQYGLGVPRDPAHGAGQIETNTKTSEVLMQFELMDKCIARLSEAVRMIDRRTDCVRLSPAECEPGRDARAELCGSTIEQYISDRAATIDGLSDRLQTILRELRI